MSQELSDEFDFLQEAKDLEVKLKGLKFEVERSNNQTSMLFNNFEAKMEELNQQTGLSHERSNVLELCQLRLENVLLQEKIEDCDELLAIKNRQLDLIRTSNPSNRIDEPSASGVEDENITKAIDLSLTVTPMSSSLNDVNTKTDSEPDLGLDWFTDMASDIHGVDYCSVTSKSLHAGFDSQDEIEHDEPFNSDDEDIDKVMGVSNFKK